MATIDMKSIGEKCRAWSNTGDGQAAMDEAVDNLRRKGSSRVTSKAKMFAIGHVLRQFIINSASGYNLPPGVISDIQSLTVSRPKETPDGFVIELSFGADLTRESLYPEGYPEGLRNIIALYNNGMYTKHRAFKKTDSGIITGARYHTPLYFMSQAVEDFNNTYGGMYNVEATLNGIYD